MQGWLPNSPVYDALNQYPALLQIFPADLGWKIEDIAVKTAGCVEHARDKGFTYAGVTYQTYAGAQPSWYDLRGTYSLYTGDNVSAGEWSKWK